MAGPAIHMIAVVGESWQRYETWVSESEWRSNLHVSLIITITAALAV